MESSRDCSFKASHILLPFASAKHNQISNLIDAVGVRMMWRRRGLASCIARHFIAKEAATGDLEEYTLDALPVQFPSESSISNG